MDNKITTLLEKLDLTNECKSCFNNSKLIKIIGNKEKTNYTFYIDNENTLSIDNYKQFVGELRKSFDSIEKLTNIKKIIHPFCSPCYRKFFLKNHPINIFNFFKY